MPKSANLATRCCSHLEQIDSLTADQTAQLTVLYQAEWWTAGRAHRDVERMLNGSDIVFGLAERDTGALVAFARALTDGVFKAIILDLIVRQDYRGLGVGDSMIHLILAHPRLQGVRHKELYCLPELMPFYRRFGFSTEVGAIALMRHERRRRLASDLGAEPSAAHDLR